MPVNLPNPKLFKPSIPKAPIHHSLFSTKFSKHHNFYDERWTPGTFTDQYKTMVSLLEKNSIYKIFEQRSKRSKNLKLMKRLRMENRDGSIRIERAFQGDTNRIRNILIKHKEMQRLYQKMPSHLIVDSVNDRTFNKRKEKDRLKYRLKILLDKYKYVLIEESKLQDRIKYESQSVLLTEIKSWKVEKDLVNSSTRLKSLKVISKAYTSILNILKSDELYYDSVLDALIKDISEQSNFINQIVMLGVPAIKNYKILFNDFMIMQRKTQENLKKNAIFVSTSKKKVTQETEKVNKIVRESSFRHGPKHNYVRETISMTNMLSKSENISKLIDDLKIETCTPDVTLILPTIQTQITNNYSLNKKLKIELMGYDLQQNSYKRSLAIKDKLIYNLTQEELSNLETIDTLKIQVKKTIEERKEHDVKLTEFGKVLNIMNLNLRNILNVVRHVNYKPSVESRNIEKYPNAELPLPLLKFDNRPIAMAPMRSNEKCEVLLTDAVEAIRTLMKVPLLLTVNWADTSNIDSFEDTYKRQYLTGLAENIENQVDADKPKPLFTMTEKTDPNVKSRLQIKTMSTKLVEDNKKKMEDE